KLQRSKLATDYIDSIKNDSTKDSPNIPLQEQSFIHLILEEITQLYGLTDINTRQSFTELGFDSLRSTELINGLNKNLNTQLSPTIVFEYPTIEQLAKYLVNNTAGNNS